MHGGAHSRQVAGQIKRRSSDFRGQRATGFRQRMGRTISNPAGPCGVLPRFSSDVVVAGGGLAGLSCAAALAREGLRVTVLEASREAGGRARSWRHPDSSDEVDIGPHVVHSEYGNFLEFLRWMGTDSLITWQPRKLISLATSRGLFPLRHRALPTPFSLFPDMLRAPDISTRDALSNIGITRSALRFSEDDVPELDRRTALDVLREHGVTDRIIDWFWRLASMTVMNVPLELCSAAALLRVHSQLIGHRQLHFGFPRVGLSGLYVGQAIAAIELAGGNVLLDTEAMCVESSRGVHRVTTRGGDQLVGGSVVLALPPAALARVRPGVAQAEAFEPSPYKSVYLWFDRPVAEESFWSLLWRPDRVNYDFYELARIRPVVYGGASLIASNVIFSRHVAGWTDAEIVTATRRELASVAPDSQDARLLHADVHHIPMAIPCPFVGTETRRPAATTAQPGVFLAGDWTRTRLPCSMESAVRSGFLAAEACLAHVGEQRNIAKEPRPNDGLAGWMQKRGRAAGARSVSRS
jgi:squalene-associated FAD-dependent desaturase